MTTKLLKHCIKNYEKTLNEVTLNMSNDARGIIENYETREKDLTMLALNLALDASIKSYIAHIILQAKPQIEAEVEDLSKEKKPKKEKSEKC